MHADEGPVVVNTTPIIGLSLVGGLDLFRSLYREVVIPPAVRAEVEAGSREDLNAIDLSAAPWIETVPLQDPRRADLLSDLDRGEAEVLALAQERRARLVVIDERLGRQHARRLELQLTGTVGVLLRAKEQSLIPSVGPVLRTLKKGGFYLSTPLIEEAIRLAGE